MSDFITGLRGDLVDAADRRRRRSPLGRAARRVQSRVWRPRAVSQALAIAAILIAVVVAARALRSTAPTAARLHVAAVIHVGGEPVNATFAGGSLWIGNTGGEVTRIASMSHRVTARIAAGGTISDIAGDSDGIWVLTPTTPGIAAILTRIDPRTGRVAASIPAHVNSHVTLASGEVWSVDVRGTAVRIDPASGSVIRRVPSAGPALLVANGATVWTLDTTGTLVEVDAPTARVRHRVRHVVGVVAEFHPLGPVGLAADRNGAWVTSPDAGTVTRISAGRILRPIHVGPGASTVASTDTALWVAYGDYPHARFRLARIDPNSGRIISTVSLGNHTPTALVPMGHDVWVIGGDGTILLVEP
jgi:hypothetical protein